MNYLSANSRPLVTYTLIGLCALVFFAVEASGLPQAELLALYLPANADFHYWQYLTSLFMHGSLTHLLFNMLALWMFGSALEHLWGGPRFLFFYLACGVGAGLIYNMINTYQFNQLAQQLQALGLSVEDLQRIATRGEYHSDLAASTVELLKQY